MLVAQRHLTTIMALGLSLLAAAACGASGDGAALTSAESPGEVAAATTVVAVSSADVTAATTTTEQPATLVAPDPAVAETTVAPSATPEPPSATPGSDDLDAVEAALEDADICGVYEGLARYELSAASTDKLIAQVHRIQDIMIRSSAIVSPGLAADWETLADGTADMLESLEADRESGSGFTASHYDDDEYRAASSRVADWMGRNCA